MNFLRPLCVAASPLVFQCRHKIRGRMSGNLLHRYKRSSKRIFWFGRDKRLTFANTPIWLPKPGVEMPPLTPDEATVPEDEPDCLYEHIDVECRGHDRAVLQSYESFALSAAKHLGIEVSKTWVPERVFWRNVVLRSVFVKKKYRTEYEIRTNFRCWQIQHVTGSSADTYLEYIQRNLPEGVGMKVTKYLIEQLPPHISPPENPTWTVQEKR